MKRKYIMTVDELRKILEDVPGHYDVSSRYFQVPGDEIVEYSIDDVDEFIQLIDKERFDEFGFE